MICENETKASLLLILYIYILPKRIPEEQQTQTQEPTSAGSRTYC